MDLDKERAFNQYEVKDLIRLVKSHPIIYDATRTDFKIPDRKDRVWSLVGSVISLSAEECRKRWRTLRERYTRELKRFKYYDEEPTWEYFNEMSFLNRHIKCRSARKRQYNSNNIKDPLENSNSQWDDIKSDCDSPQLVEPLDEKELIAATVEAVSKTEEDEIFYEERLDDTNSFQQPPNKFAKPSHNDHSYHEVQTNSTPNRCDEDGLFCEAVAFSLRRLSRLNNIKAKVEIYKVLERLIENEETSFKSINNS